MKASLKVLLPGFTGNMDDVVIYYNSHLNKYIARKKVMPKFTPSNRIMSDIYRFKDRIGISEEYINDCRLYVRSYNQKFRRQGRAMSSWPNVFLKIMRGLHHEYPGLDFNTLNRDQILIQNLPCLNVSAAIRAGYLVPVPIGQKLTSTI